MATWGVHMMIVDKLYQQGLSIDKYILKINRKNLIFFTNQEINSFVHNTCEIVRNKIIDKNVW